MPSLGLINLLEQLTELRETFYLLEYWFIMNEYNSGMARRKRCIDKIWGKGVELPCPFRVPLSPNFPMFINLHVLRALLLAVGD